MAEDFLTQKSPPIDVQQQKGEALPRLVAIMQRLLAPDGCPWDREQTLESLRKYVLEEAAEVVDAIDDGDREGLKEELGDLLLQIVFQSELTRKENAFAIDDVVHAICDKLVRRHPHVFGDESAQNSKEVLENWERLKAKEKVGRKLLDGVPRNLAALARAQAIGQKVARVGFDWPSIDGSRDKVTEEVRELDAAIASGEKKAIEEELGDVLFALVNLARHLDIDAEAALRGTATKFTKRFHHVEDRITNEHGGFAKGPFALDLLDRYWDEAKAKERA